MYRINVPTMKIDVNMMKCELWKQTFNVMANKYFESGSEVFKNLISDVNACSLNEQHEFIEKIIDNHKSLKQNKKI